MSRKIIITVLSTNPKYKNKDTGMKSPDNISYNCDRGEPVETSWTNEAGLMYLLRNNSGFTDIICLCSRETFNDDYRRDINDILKREVSYHIEPEFIEYSTDDPAADITNKLAREFRFVSSDTVCIDTSGGYRSVIYSLVYLFRYFEYIGVNIEWMIYSSKNGSKGSISEISSTFRMFTLINGAHEFTSTGNPCTLKQYFSSSQNKTVRSLLDNMQNFYDNISLCRIGDELDRSFREMDELLSEGLHSYERDNGYYENRFFDLVPVIREKFFSESKSRYLSLIEWCLNNDLLQQAITIYVEKLPKAYFTELGFLTADFEKLEKKSPNPGTEIYQDYFITAAKDEIAENLRDMLKMRAQLIKEPNRSRSRPLIPVDTACEEMYQLVLELRDTFYNNKGERTLVKSSKASDKLLERTFGSFEKLPLTVNKLIAADNVLVGFMRNETGNVLSSEMKKLKGVVKGVTDENVSVNIKKDELVRLRLDYLYMKYIRNQINHASESNTYSDEYKKKFSSMNPERYIFPKGDNFSADHIRKFMSESIDRIKKLYQ